MRTPKVLWEHYNARALTPEMVAQSFVAPRQFMDVARARNSVLLGPRGSGKTTLLRMLDPRALSTWSEPSGEALRNAIDYIGVFVPVDKAWISSLENVLAALPEHDRSAAELAVYSLAVARSVVDAMVWRVGAAPDTFGAGFSVRLDANAERELAQHLAELWIPGRQVVSLLQVRLHLTRELALLPKLITEQNHSDRARTLTNAGSPVKLAAAACEIFNMIVGDEDRRWAILCDELEIAPASVQQHLFASLRATPNPLILKMALTPAIRLPGSAGAEHPVAAHDYDPISLSYPTRSEGAGERSRERFCRGIWTYLVSPVVASRPHIDDPWVALEKPPSSIVPPEYLASDSGTADARLGPSFRRLAKLDESFARFLAEKGVNVGNLDAEPRLLDSVVRKVRPLVSVRAYYLKRSEGQDSVRRVSRRAAVPYCGARGIFAVSESHPRWLKSTLGSMVGDASTSPPYISLVSQSREIKIAVSRIVARLKSFPAVGENSTYGLIEQIGKFFAAQVCGPKFKADPILGFTVDAVDEAVLKCLENALYIGALVPLDVEEHVYLLNGISGARFRLSNWLAPHFRLPLVAGKSVALSAILAKDMSFEDGVDDGQLSLGLDQ